MSEVLERDNQAYLDGKISEVNRAVKAEPKRTFLPLKTIRKDASIGAT